MGATGGVRPIGNAVSTSTFDGESARDDRIAQRRAGDRRAPYLSQNGTESAPRWYGPRLRPAFAAQVLGQVLMRHPGAPPSPAPYSGGAQIRSGRLLCRSI